MEERDRLKGEEEVDWSALGTAEERVREGVKEARTRLWREMLDRGASVEEMWKVVNQAGGK